MNILLVCNAGMSSSILVDKMNKAAAAQNLDVVVEARSNNAINEEVGKWDICLVGPQIIYAVDSIKATLGIPVAAVEPRTYAMANGEEALKQAFKMHEEGKA
ncbi:MULTISPECIES: PTS sugar transporter subunit IIB [Clostridia]|uniref:PTS sugar transporter subunit IIB n=1 Tax=Clostridia TaxID=186801 RepID=UPI000EA031E0|nr:MULTISPECIES: PTS sugar transporter subunit IIB [Clostridia]NBJ69495.1 PTS sugar transporter subunit IIB [Roseburia sp. 1XD42-34]RKI78569.1 PTS sugar transporter subunit IIB [Clostridium sp. 1xD42-85]